MFARAQPRKHQRKILRADVEVFTHPAPQHDGRDISTAAFLLRFVQHPQDHALFASQAIADVG